MYIGQNISEPTPAATCEPALILSGFEVGDYRLRPHHYEPLFVFLGTLTQRLHNAGGTIAGLKLEITGHADATGSDRVNSGLSFSRALEVKIFIAETLARKKVNLPIRISGEGESQPMRGATRRQIRRVELRLCRTP